MIQTENKRSSSTFTSNGEISCLPNFLFSEGIFVSDDFGLRFDFINGSNNLKDWSVGNSPVDCLHRKL